MIGDAYFQLRAQIGTALFSLLRLATEAGASESVLAALRTAQDGLRESFLFLTLGPAGGGKSTFLNSLFEREFCGAVEPTSAGRVALFQYGEEVRDVALPGGIVECQRPHGFLRDFTVVDTPGFATLGDPAVDLAPYLARADAIFFVVAAGTAPEASWDLLVRLGRDVLKRTVFVVWQRDQVSSGEAAPAVKRLRQAMLKNLGLACPIFTASAHDLAEREKLLRWLESEVIFSTTRRVRLEDLDRLAEEALREVVARPRAAEESWRWAEERLRGLRHKLADDEEQSERQIAGALWTLAQSFDALRRRGETLLRGELLLLDLWRVRGAWRAGFAREVETQAKESLSGQIADALDSLEADLREAEDRHRRDCREIFGEELPGAAPPFPRTEIAEAAALAETPLELERMLTDHTARTALLLRPPIFAAIGALAIALGALPFLGFVAGTASLAGGVILFALLLALLLRDQVVAAFGAHFTANRGRLLTALETPLRRASRDFYAALARPLDGRLSAHSAERHRHEPLLARIGQLEQTFSRISASLRGSVAPIPQAEEAATAAE